MQAVFSETHEFLQESSESSNLNDLAGYNISQLRFDDASAVSVGGKFHQVIKI